MPDDSDPRRDAIDDAMVAIGPSERVTEEGGAALLTGWVIVQEWMDEHGNRWLSRANSASKARWDADGMLHEALYGDWPEEADE